MVFERKSGFTERVREREREIKRKRERILQLSYTESVLPDVLSRSSEMVEKASVEEEGGGSQQAEERSHVHHHLFVYIETTDHLEE